MNIGGPNKHQKIVLTVTCLLIALRCFFPARLFEGTIHERVDSATMVFQIFGIIVMGGMLLFLLRGSQVTGHHFLRRAFGWKRESPDSTSSLPKATLGSQRDRPFLRKALVVTACVATVAVVVAMLTIKLTTGQVGGSFFLLVLAYLVIRWALMEWPHKPKFPKKTDRH